ncbi:MAG: hypothetical protein KZQ85_04215 [Candidatus Thiodiazotropha sp. (ex Myrtea sp. 'scaly one' KF741663)]|nr:hypothetical protein [Candidatus Thiodiazotropha sp. (ex Myrtea sp. 'scaly one' KF741663)]
MTTEHELDLLENAVDSLNEALRKYKEGLNGDLRAYKFAIIHYAHFIELLFKYYVSESHPLLIYKNPFSKKIQKENTIGLWEAIQFLKNEGKEVEPEFFKDMEWLKKLRNDIEHFKFTMDVAEARRALGRLTQSVLDFNDTHAEIDIFEHIDADTFKVFEELADEHKAALSNARREAEEESEDAEVYDCEICWSKGTAIKIDGKYVCKLCGDEDPIVECTVCTEDYRQSECSIWNDDHPPYVDYICGYCEERIRNM